MHEKLRWEIVDNPHVCGERIRIARPWDDEGPPPHDQSDFTPGIIPFPGIPTVARDNLHQQECPPNFQK